jgi:hypothetical protein
MTIHPDSDAATATQYLMWALELIEKTGDEKAAHHARLAVKALRANVFLSQLILASTLSSAEQVDPQTGKQTAFERCDGAGIIIQGVG